MSDMPGATLDDIWLFNILILQRCRSTFFLQISNFKFQKKLSSFLTCHCCKAKAASTVDSCFTFSLLNCIAIWNEKAVKFFTSFKLFWCLNTRRRQPSLHYLSIRLLGAAYKRRQLPTYRKLFHIDREKRKYISGQKESDLAKYFNFFPNSTTLPSSTSSKRSLQRYSQIAAEASTIVVAQLYFVS